MLAGRRRRRGCLRCRKCRRCGGIFALAPDSYPQSQAKEGASASVELSPEREWGVKGAPTPSCAGLAQVVVRLWR